MYVTSFVASYIKSMDLYVSRKTAGMGFRRLPVIGLLTYWSRTHIGALRGLLYIVNYTPIPQRNQDIFIDIIFFYKNFYSFLVDAKTPGAEKHREFGFIEITGFPFPSERPCG